MPNRNNGPSTYTTRMRLTSNGQPYARDLHDIFAALILQLKLGNHRYLFRNYPQSFTTEEAVELLNDLGVTHIIRHPDPDDPTRLVSTKATTRFSMSREMAKRLMQQFLNAWLMESATDSNSHIKDNGIYTITHKGKVMLIEFGQRALMSVAHLSELLVKVDPQSVVTLDRLPSNDDMLALTPSNLLVAFRAMIQSLPMEALLLDDVGGLECKVVREYTHTFYGYQCFEWICSYLTVLSRQEADLVACEFVLYGWIEHVLDKSDRTYSSRHAANDMKFNTGRNVIYHLTPKGRAALDEGLLTRNNVASSVEEQDATTQHRRDSAVDEETNSPRGSFDSSRAPSRRSFTMGLENDWQWGKLKEIIADPVQRMCLREFMKSKFCEENLNFHLDFQQLTSKKSAQAKTKARLTDCYAIYDKYLAPEAVMELNIEHTLRQNINQFISRSFSVVSANNTTDLPFFSPSTDPQQQSHVVVIVLSGNSGQCFKTLMRLYEEVNYHVCRLMAQDTMPPFVKTEKYKDLVAHQLKQEQEKMERAAAGDTSSGEDDYADDDLSFLADDLDQLELDSVTPNAPSGL